MEMRDLTRKILGCAIEVHRRLGPGLLESAYRRCLAYELRNQHMIVSEEFPIPAVYDEIRLECGYRADLIVNKLVVLELKAKSEVLDIDKAQLLSYLRLLDMQVGLLINFHTTKLMDGVHRIVNNYRE